MTAFDWNIFIIFFFLIALAFDCWTFLLRSALTLALIAVCAAIPTLILHALAEIIR